MRCSRKPVAARFRSGAGHAALSGEDAPAVYVRRRKTAISPASCEQSRIGRSARTYRGRRREPGLRVQQQSSAPGEVGRSSLTSSSPSPISGSDEARAPVSPTPSGVDWAGNVEMRCAHRSSTRAGPFDAVIDVVRSRRLMRGARLLLLPALGLLCALLRCLRRLPSFLRHAALLA